MNPSPSSTERSSRKYGRRLPYAVLASIFTAGLFLLAVIFPGAFGAVSPFSGDISQALSAPSSEHWFGTDQLGRDVYARVIHGMRYSLGIGLGATLISVVIGALIGLIAAVSHRFADAFLMRSIDILLAFPSILLALLVIVVVEPILGRGSIAVLLAIGIGSFPSYARIVRAEAMVVRRSGYVEAATVLGVGHWRSVWRHVLPNALGSLGIMATLGVGMSIITGSALSFLGLGPAAPTPEWGLMLAEGRNLLSSAWWTSVFPGLTLTISVIAITFIGQYIQRRFEGRREM